mgnify:CR=1 FL=1
MENWVISDEGSNSITINGSLIVPAQGYTVLGEETDTSINGGAPVDYGWGTESNFTLGNGDDEIIISGMSLGYAAEAPENTLVSERTPLDDFTTFLN